MIESLCRETTCRQPRGVRGTMCGKIRGSAPSSHQFDHRDRVPGASHPAAMRAISAIFALDDSRAMLRPIVRMPRLGPHVVPISCRMKVCKNDWFTKHSAIYRSFLRNFCENLAQTCLLPVNILHDADAEMRRCRLDAGYPARQYRPAVSHWDSCSSVLVVGCGRATREGAGRRHPRPFLFSGAAKS